MLVCVRLSRSVATARSEGDDRKCEQEGSAPCRIATDSRGADHSVTAAHESTRVGLDGVGTWTLICLVDAPPDPWAPICVKSE